MLIKPKKWDVLRHTREKMKKNKNRIKAKERSEKDDKIIKSKERREKDEKRTKE